MKKKHIRSAILIGSMGILMGIARISAYLTDSDVRINSLTVDEAVSNNVYHRLWGFNTDVQVENTAVDADALSLQTKDVIKNDETAISKGTFKSSSDVTGVAESGQNGAATVFQHSYIDFFQDETYYIQYEHGFVDKDGTSLLHGCYLNCYTMDNPYDSEDDPSDTWTYRFSNTPNDTYQKYSMADNAFVELPVGTMAQGQNADYTKSYQTDNTLRQSANPGAVYYFDYVPIDYSITYDLGTDYDQDSVTKKNAPVNDPRNPKSYTVLSEIQFYEPTWEGYEFLGWKLVSDTNPDNNGEPKNYQNSTNQEYIHGINTRDSLGDYKGAKIDASSYQALHDSLAKRSTGNIILEAVWQKAIDVEFSIAPLKGAEFYDIADTSLKTNTISYVWNTEKQCFERRKEGNAPKDSYYEAKLTVNGTNVPYIAFWADADWSDNSVTASASKLFSLAENPERIQSEAKTGFVKYDDDIYIDYTKTVFDPDEVTIDFYTLTTTQKDKLEPVTDASGHIKAYKLKVYGYVNPMLTLTTCIEGHATSIGVEDYNKTNELYTYENSGETYYYLADGKNTGEKNIFRPLTSHDIKKLHYDPRMKLEYTEDLGGIGKIGNAYKVPKKTRTPENDAFPQYAFSGWYSDVKYDNTSIEGTELISYQNNYEGFTYLSDDTNNNNYIDRLSGSISDSYLDYLIANDNIDTSNTFTLDYQATIYAGWEADSAQAITLTFDKGILKEDGTAATLSTTSDRMTEVLIIPPSSQNGDLPKCRYKVDDHTFECWAVEINAENEGNYVEGKDYIKSGDKYYLLLSKNTFSELKDKIEANSLSNDVKLYAVWKKAGFTVILDVNIPDVAGIKNKTRDDANGIDDPGTAAFFRTIGHSPFENNEEKSYVVITESNAKKGVTLDSVVREAYGRSFTPSATQLDNHYYEYSRILDSSEKVVFNENNTNHITDENNGKIYTYTLVDSTQSPLGGSDKTKVGTKTFLVKYNDNLYYYHYKERTEANKQGYWMGQGDIILEGKYNGTLTDKFEFDGKPNCTWLIDHEGAYKYNCWNTEPDGSGVTYTADSILSGEFGEEITLYAMWQRWSIDFNAVRVKYDDNGKVRGEYNGYYFELGNSNTNTISYITGNNTRYIGTGNYYIPRVNDIGCQFDYWTLSAGNDSKYSNIDLITGELKFKSLPFINSNGNSAHGTLVAHYETEKKVPIYFDPGVVDDKGTVAKGSITSVKVDRNSSVRLNTNQQMIETGRVLADENAEVYPNQGFYNTAKSEYDDNTIRKLDHWEIRDENGNTLYVIPDGGVVDDIKISDKLGYQPDSINLYAVWDDSQFRINYFPNNTILNDETVYQVTKDKDGNEIEVPATFALDEYNLRSDLYRNTQSFAIKNVTDETINFKTVPNASGSTKYTFVGWNTSYDGTGDWYAAPDSDEAKALLHMTDTVTTEVSRDIPGRYLDLYAIWKIYSVGFQAGDGTFVLNDGTTTDKIAVYYAGIAPVVDAATYGTKLKEAYVTNYMHPVKYGYKLDSWGFINDEIKNRVASINKKTGTVIMKNGITAMGDIDVATQGTVWNRRSFKAVMKKAPGTRIYYTANGGTVTGSLDVSAVQKYITYTQTQLENEGNTYKVVDPEDMGITAPSGKSFSHWVDQNGKIYKVGDTIEAADKELSEQVEKGNVTYDAFGDLPDENNYAADITLKPVWVNEMYTVIFKDGEKEVGRQKIEGGKTATLNALSTMVSGKTNFYKWKLLNSEASDGTSIYLDDMAEVKDLYQFTNSPTVKEVTLEAVWLDEITITYHKNDGSLGENEADRLMLKANSGEIEILSNNTFTRDNFQFLAWSNAADLNSATVAYAGGETVTITENTDFYAVWGSDIDYNKNKAWKVVTGGLNEPVYSNNDNTVTLTNTANGSRAGYLDFSSDITNEKIYRFETDFTVYQGGSNTSNRWEIAINTGDVSSVSGSFLPTSSYIFSLRSPDPPADNTAYQYYPYYATSNGAVSGGDMKTLSANTTYHLSLEVDKLASTPYAKLIVTQGNTTLFEMKCTDINKIESIKGLHTLLYPNKGNNTINTFSNTKIYIPDVQEIFFDANNGQGQISSIGVKEGTASFTLPAMPDTFSVPTNKAFLGWSTSKENPFKIYAAGETFNVSDFSEGYTLYACWAENVQNWEFSEGDNIPDTTKSTAAKPGISIDDGNLMLSIGTMSGDRSVYISLDKTPENNYVFESDVKIPTLNSSYVKEATPFQFAITNGTTIPGRTLLTSSGYLLSVTTTSDDADFSVNGKQTTSITNGMKNNVVHVRMTVTDGLIKAEITNGNTTYLTYQQLNTTSTKLHGLYFWIPRGSGNITLDNVNIYELKNTSTSLTITYQDGETTIEKQYSDSQQEIKLPTAEFLGLTAADDKELAGWSITTAEDAVIYPADSYFDTALLDADKKLYARWKEPIVISFETGTEDTMNDIHVFDNEFPIDPPAIRAAKRGGEFIGWTIKDSDDETLYIAGTNQIPAQSGNFTLVANWKEAPKISYNLDYADAVNPADDYYTSDYVVPGYTGERIGYEFLGWKLNDDTVEVGKALPTAPESDITLVAQWKQLPKISYDLNYAGASSLDDAYYTSDYTVPECTTAREGYQFTGWQIQNSTDEKLYQSGDTLNPAPTSDITLVAQWKKIPKISYNLNYEGASRDADNYTSAYRVPDASRDGYRFAGWKIQDSADTTLYQYKDALKPAPTDDITLVAQWVEQVTVTFKAKTQDSNAQAVENGKKIPVKLADGTLSYTTIETSGNDFIAKVDKDGKLVLTSAGATNTGKKLLGWNTSDDFANSSLHKIGEELSIGENENTTLYAQWYWYLQDFDKSGLTVQNLVDNGEFVKNANAAIDTPVATTSGTVYVNVIDGYLSQQLPGGSGIRGNFLKFNLPSLTNYKIEYDFQMAMGTSGNNEEQMALTTSKNSNNLSSTYMFSIASNKQNTTNYYINTTDFTGTSNLTLNSTNWYHLDVTVNGANVTYSITQAGQTTATASGAGNNVTIDGIFTLVPRYNGKINLDNIKVYEPDNTITITYAANDGSGNTMAIDAEKNTETAISGSMFKHQESSTIKFVSWNTQPDGSGTSYAADDIITPTENITLYAQWESVADDIGTTERNNGFGTVFSAPYQINDGETKKFVIANYSDGATTWDNLLLYFASEENPSTNYTVVRADNWAWGSAWGEASNVQSSNIGSTFLTDMKNATITTLITRSGNTVTANLTMVSNENGNTHSETATFTIPDGNDCYLYLSSEKCYDRILLAE